jgi:hypothetical protein
MILSAIARSGVSSFEKIWEERISLLKHDLQGEFKGAKRVLKKWKVSNFLGHLQDMIKWETEYLQFK